MVGVHTTHDVYLSDGRSLHLTCTLFNLVEREAPGIGIAYTAAERAELAVKDADIRGLDVYVTVVVDQLATCCTLATYGKLAKQPQWSILPQCNSILCRKALATTYVVDYV